MEKKVKLVNGVPVNKMPTFGQIFISFEVAIAE